MEHSNPHLTHTHTHGMALHCMTSHIQATSMHRLSSLSFRVRRVNGNSKCQQNHNSSGIMMFVMLTFCRFFETVLSARALRTTEIRLICSLTLWPCVDTRYISNNCIEFVMICYSVIQFQSNVINVKTEVLVMFLL